MPRKQLGALILSLTFTLTPLLLTGSSTSLELRRRALADALDQQWQYTMRTSPEYASLLGDKRYNDQVSDVSIEAVKRESEKTRYFLAKFQAIDVSGFPEQEVLNKRLMIRDLAESIEGEQFKDWEMPVDQMSGIHINVPRLVPLLSFRKFERLSRLPQSAAQVARIVRPNRFEDACGNGRPLDAT